MSSPEERRWRKSCANSEHHASTSVKDFAAQWILHCIVRRIASAVSAGCEQVTPTGGHLIHNDRMALQNIYDDPKFFEGYLRLRATDTGLNGVLEQPAIGALLPSLVGLRVLDLGCGFGDLAREARRNGAAHVMGIDLSERMLAEARSRTSDPNIEFVRCSIEEFKSPAASWDLAVCSLALHYVENYAGVVHQVAHCLRPGGTFVFSVEHPLVTANPSGWVRDDRGVKLHWALDHYAAEGERRMSWFVDGVTKYHRTVSTYVNQLLDAGFAIRRLAEPLPVQEAVKARPELLSEFRRPPFLLIRAERL
jgi:2-polyprenyl-3-methyl-5-hydroxy-6-metoxy-1,4-benzoquinol methylase